MARFTWRSRSELDTAAKEAELARIRSERDRALRDSDWTQLPDAPLTEPERQAWSAHRQELRDLPDQAQGKTLDELRAVTLPEPPAGNGRR